MLVVFVVELLLEIIYSGNKGNCGCFGTLIEMTPLEALLKNVFSIGLLFLYYYLDKKQTNNSSVLDENQVAGSQVNKYKSSIQYSAIVNTLLFCILGVFLAGPIRFQKEEPASIPLDVQPQEVVAVNSVDTVKTVLPKKDSVVKVDLGPKAKESGFRNIFVDIDQNKKILCFFSPGCDHCRAAAKELTELKAKNKNMPPIRIIFMDEGPEEIPDFFKFAGEEYPFYVLDIITFWKKIGKNNDVPGVMYLWNGNVQKFYQGIDNEKFNGAAFKKIINKK
jgi:thiol-disulfide isomerase/thioredoxin